jgi:putative ABC transport system ATP-binding protein
MMLKFDKISKVYRTEDIETTALNEISLEINEGEFVAIMGPSGCGKSSILNIFGLLGNPSAGKYYFLDHEVSSYSEKQLANIRKSNIGYIFQEFNLIDELTVYENVELALLYQNKSKSERRELVKKILEDVGILHRMNHYPKQLSGGQQQRVAIARALVAKPKLILADEPTGNLDSEMGQEVMDMLKALNKSGTTLIMVTHSDYHASYANRILYLLDGKMQEYGSQHEVVQARKSEVEVCS